MNISIIESFSEIKSSKLIDKTTISKILEETFRTEIIRKFGTDENFDIILNPSNGDFEIWRNKLIVPESELIDTNSQITLSEARKIEEDFEMGEDLYEEFKFENLGRRSISNIKQNLISKIKEQVVEKTVDKFNDMIGLPYESEVRHIRRDMVILMDVDGNELILPKENQLRGEFYKKGSSLLGVVESAEIVRGKALIKISRSSEKFLEFLLENEIPEISDGVITIRQIVRDPGTKAKVLVESYDDNIDPIGVCVGMKGSRINRVVHELSGETIDIINYTENKELLINRCLKPANISSIKIDEGIANIYMPSTEIGKAVGRGGSNIRLTSKITGLEINIINDSYDSEDDVLLTEFNDEVEDWILNEFIKVGLDTAKSVLQYSVSELERKTDLEVITIENLLELLKSEFDEDED